MFLLMFLTHYVTLLTLLPTLLQGILELTDMSLLMFPPELALDLRYAYNLRYLNLSGNK
jgi:hypothetical protein